MKEKNMAATVAQMTKRELREMMETLIEQKLIELLGDPDEGLNPQVCARQALAPAESRSSQ
jgi:hypothetical protein